jgi:hypothetical protein
MSSFKLTTSNEGCDHRLDPFNPLASIIIFSITRIRLRARSLRRRPAAITQTRGGVAAERPPQETIKLDVEIDATDSRAGKWSGHIPPGFIRAGVAGLLYPEVGAGDRQ